MIEGLRIGLGLGLGLGLGWDYVEANPIPKKVVSSRHPKPRHKDIVEFLAVKYYNEKDDVEHFLANPVTCKRGCIAFFHLIHV
jgi:hypothetical protein